MPGTVVSMYSAVCLLRGRIYDALENRTRAIEWYTCAYTPPPVPGAVHKHHICSCSLVGLH